MDPLDDLRAKIDEYGWAVRNVSDADPSACLSYTVGLAAHEHPEVVMTGLPPEVGTAFLNIVGEIVVREGGQFRAGEATTQLAEGPAMPVIEVLDRSGSCCVRHLWRRARPPDRVDRLAGSSALGTRIREPGGFAAPSWISLTLLRHPVMPHSARAESWPLGDQEGPAVSLHEGCWSS